MISVVMPCYNAEEFLGSAIESILNQTFKDFELIIVDDKAKDNSLQIAQEYAAKDARVRVIPMEKNGGVSKAMNRGIEEARYDWIAIMHADDIALPERLEKQFAAAQNDPEVVLWGTDGYHMNSKNKIVSSFRVGPTSKEECQQMRQAGRRIQAIHPTVFFKKDAHAKAGGYDTRFDGCEDVDFFDRILEYGPIVTLTEPLLKYRLHSGSLAMKTYVSQAASIRYVVERHKHRMMGKTLTREEFDVIEQQKPRMERFHEYIGNLSGMYYRQAGIFYGEGNYIKTAVYLTIATVMKPVRSIKRLWTQVFSPATRRKLRQVGG